MLQGVARRPYADLEKGRQRVRYNSTPEDFRRGAQHLRHLAAKSRELADEYESSADRWDEHADRLEAELEAERA